MNIRNTKSRTSGTNTYKEHLLYNEKKWNVKKIDIVFDPPTFRLMQRFYELTPPTPKSYKPSPPTPKFDPYHPRHPRYLADSLQPAHELSNMI